MGNIKDDAIKVINEIMEKSKISEGDIFIVGCSSSEMIGNQMGTSKDGQTDDAVNALYDVISKTLTQHGICMAVQCCEHLNRAVVIERKIAKALDLEIVNVIPQPHAGGAFAVKHYNSISDPVVVENIKQKAIVGSFLHLGQASHLSVGASSPPIWITSDGKMSIISVSTPSTKS